MKLLANLVLLQFAWGFEQLFLKEKTPLRLAIFNDLHLNPNYTER